MTKQVLISSVLAVVALCVVLFYMLRDHQMADPSIVSTDSCQSIVAKIEGLETVVSKQTSSIEALELRLEKINITLQNLSSNLGVQVRSAGGKSAMPSLEGDSETAGANGASVSVVSAEDIEKEESLTDNIAEAVVRKMEEKRNNDRMLQSNKEEKKPPLEDLVERLELDAIAEEEMELAINSGKNEAFELLLQTREDGGNFVDDLIAMFQSENPERDQKKVFGRLFSEKVVGTDETYVQRLQKIKEGVHESFKLTMGEDRYKEYRQMRLEPTEIQTGYDPFAEYFRERGIPIPDENDVDE